MANKVAGVDVLLKCKVGATQTAVGGQKGASLKRSANTIDTTDKNSGGWAESMAGVLSWSVECESFIVLGDTAMEALFTAFSTRATIDIEIRIGAKTTATGYTYTGTCVITDFSEEFKSDDAVTAKITLQGASPLVRTVGTQP